MLELESPEWADVAANGLFTVELLRLVYQGDEDALDELLHQICHQFSVREVAYVAVPHLVQMARTGEPKWRVRLLTLVGWVAAGRAMHPRWTPPVPDQWREEYLAANDEARRLAADSLKEGGWSTFDAKELLGTLAALHGNINLAAFLFLLPSGTELECACCGEPMNFIDPDEPRSPSSTMLDS